MNQSSHFKVAIFAIGFSLLATNSCNKHPFVPDYTNVGGYVIGRETCQAIDADDYWLIDLTFYPNTPQYGDTLVLNSIKYTNVIKTKGLDQRLKQVGLKVSLDFKTKTADKIITSGCTVPNAVTYSLKELFIINQFEIR